MVYLSKMLRIPKKIRDDIIAHAREGLPLEVCGILAGINGIVTANYRITNTDADPEHFLMDPREQSVVFAELERTGLEIAAFYHSHPSGPDFPSAEDIRLAFYPDIPSLIVSLAKPGNPVLHAFSIRNGNVKPVAVKIIPE
jgi:proteasome lid subunit RPN8/RPN11